jgi:DNA-binding NtrC family response regulator
MHLDMDVQYKAFTACTSYVHEREICMEETLQVPRVLVVDDDETMRFTLKTFLNDAGFEVTLKPDGDSVAAMPAGNDFEVALVDRILPNGQDGVDVIRRLKNLNPLCETILITAYPTFESAADTFRNGLFDYLVKPVTRDAVCSTVRKAAEASLQKRRQQAADFKKSDTIRQGENE